MMKSVLRAGITSPVAISVRRRDGSRPNCPRSRGGKTSAIVRAGIAAGAGLAVGVGEALAVGSGSTSVGAGVGSSCPPPEQATARRTSAASETVNRNMRV